MSTERIDSIFKAAERRYGFSRSELMGKCKKARLAQTRWAVASVLWGDLGWSLNDIGALLRRDHSAIRHGLKRLAELRELDSRLDQEFLAFRREAQARQYRLPWIPAKGRTG